MGTGSAGSALIVLELFADVKNLASTMGKLWSLGVFVHPGANELKV